MQKGSEMQNESIGTGTTSPAVAGAAAPTDANKVTGDTALSPAEQGAAAMRAEFESLIKGKFKELYDERLPLYEQYAGITVDVNDLSITAAARKVADALAHEGVK